MKLTTRKLQILQHNFYELISRLGAAFASHNIGAGGHLYTVVWNF